MNAPEKIWALQYPKNVITCGGEVIETTQTEWLTAACGNAPEYHLVRPGQPISDLEFMRRLVMSEYHPYELRAQMNRWLDGDYQLAMEGL